MRLVALISAILLISGAAVAADATPPEPPRPFSLTEAQAQDYAARLQADIRQAQTVIQTATQVLNDLARQVKPAEPAQPSRQEKKK